MLEAKRLSLGLIPTFLAGEFMIFRQKLLATISNYYHLLRSTTSTSTSRVHTHTHYDIKYIILYYILVYFIFPYVRKIILVLVLVLDSSILEILEESNHAWY